MNDGEKLYLWISGKRNLTVSEQIDFCTRKLCRYRIEASVTEITDAGKNELLKPRRQFRPKGSPATISEILTAVVGGAIAINDELHNSLGKNVTQRATMKILEITPMGKNIMLQEYPVKEIRSLYGSELII